MTFVTLIDGTKVDSSGTAWQDECLTRHKHVQTLLGMRGQGSRAMRQSYLNTVEAVEGAEARRRIEAAFVDAWAKSQEGPSV